MLSLGELMGEQLFGAQGAREPARVRPARQLQLVLGAILNGSFCATGLEGCRGRDLNACNFELIGWDAELRALRAASDNWYASDPLHISM
jgi:hypothetical protein